MTEIEQKAVEKMADRIGKFYNYQITQSDTYELAKFLYAAGYRKQSDTVKEIIKKILAFSYYIKFEDTNGKDREELVVYESKIKQIAAQYGKEEK